ncbi:Pollen Ole e 1 allergen/extensin [Rhynchospora pubera]|uniref:Pollen Ole e 1 allergen/extensin n=1 Tax=Rhynchospora pubera TaxID=906938 RepID=A0AAV8GW68_9POAL|nr:Pollen Ole e 1 allergen/extensin [Rhynchospora pubera]
MAKKYNLVLVPLLVLGAIASAVRSERLSPIVVYGTVLCSDSFEQCEDTGAPPFAKATVVIRWKDETISNVTTNEAGFFQIDASFLRYRSFVELLCTVRVTTPLSQCNPKLTTKGWLQSEIELVLPTGNYKAKCFHFLPFEPYHTNVAHVAQA